LPGIWPPGGLFAFDVVNPDLNTLAQAQSRSVRLDQGPNPSSAIALEEVAAYDPVQQIRVAHLRVVEPDMSGGEIAPLCLRMFFPQNSPSHSLRRAWSLRPAMAISQVIP
jgi:hypothetical protein